MPGRLQDSNRILIVGGGVSGLSIAARLAQSGLQVTVLEASRLGYGASTRNQGWLYSGGWFAAEQPEIARLCHESLLHTLEFCPECVEPRTDSMVYLIADSDTDPGRWTSGWDEADIPWDEVTMTNPLRGISGFASSQVQHAFQLPDRAIQPEILLRRLAETAVRAGAEIRSNTPVSRLIQTDNTVTGVETARGEKIPAELVILAGNARGGSLYPGFGTEGVGRNSDVALMVLKTHLVAIQQCLSPLPVCVVDADGFNILPHGSTSVFGCNNWTQAQHGEDRQVDSREIERIWNKLNQFFPETRRGMYEAVEWAGNTVQPMAVEHIASGQVPLPTVVDHEWESVSVSHLLSVFPGRASLWPHLAEQTHRTVLEKLQSIGTQVTTPPWGSLSMMPAAAC